MDKLKPKYNLSNPNDVQELIDLLQADDLSDIEVGAGDSEEEDEIVMNQEYRRVGRGPDTVSGMEFGPDDNQEPEESNDDNNDELNTEEGNEHLTEQHKRDNRVAWMKGTFQTVERVWEPETEDYVTEPHYPVHYFLRYVPEKLFEDMAMYTNMYAIQNEMHLRPTSKSEIQTLIALHIMIGSLNKFPKIRMFWDRAIGLRVFLDNMSRDRFFQLRSCLHFVNNLEISPQTNDRLAKVRPLINAIKNRCRQLVLERHLCVDEQIIPFTGAINIKQYIKGKPCPWGIKIFVLCGQSGQAYDFLFYQGKSTPLDEKNLTRFGQAASVVLHLAQSITKSGHKLFYDNYFSSYKLLNELTEKGILAAGTIRLNRFFKPPLTSDKAIKKEGRGFSEEVISTDGVVIVKWFDNRTVCLASNYVGKGVEHKAKRWDKKEAKYTTIERPEIIKDYNQSMGGVDLLDQLISLYRIFIRSRKWTLRVAMHMIDFALVNSWLEYKKDCAKCNVPTKSVLHLLDFRIHVAESLIKLGRNVEPNKRGRPSTSSSPAVVPPPRRNHVEMRPFHEIQTDRVDHMPQFDDKKEATRCKMQGCKGRSHIFCDKCGVHLCLVRNRNCFVTFHRN